MLQARDTSVDSLLGRFLVPARGRPRTFRYGAAILLPIAAMALTGALAQTSLTPFFPLFTVAVMFASMFGGMWPGLVSVAVSALINVLLVPPEWSVHVASFDNWVRTGLFALTGCGIAVILGAIAALQNRIQIQHSQISITLRSIGDAVIATDIHGNITFMNPVAEQATGWNLAEAQGLALEQVFSIFNESTRAPIESQVRQVLEKQAAIALANHTALLRKDGTEIPIEDSAAPIRDAQQQIVGVVLVFRDITRIRLNEAALRRADRLSVAGKLASTIAHEMNNPLEAVANLVYLAAQDEDLPPALKHSLQLAQSELRRAIEGSRRTLWFRRVENHSARIDLRSFVDSVLELYESTAASRGVRMTNHIAPEHTVTMVPSEMRQLLSNLVSNALDAMPRGGALHIESTPANGDGAVHLIISDTGSGIPPEHLERIFEPFFTTKQEVGTGLGLWVARRIAEEHGGRLLADSDTNGSRFTVILPAEIGADAPDGTGNVAEPDRLTSASSD